MSRIRKGKNAGPVAVRLTANKSRPGGDSGVANGKPHPVQRVTEFPKSPAADEVVSDRIIFEIGDSRFAIQWTANRESPISKMILSLTTSSAAGDLGNSVTRCTGCGFPFATPLSPPG